MPSTQYNDHPESEAVEASEAESALDEGMSFYDDHAAKMNKKPRRLFSFFWAMRILLKIQHFIDRHGFSTLSRRLLVTNLLVLFVLAIAILYLNEFRAGLINARIESLRTQGQIIAAALGASASVETDVLTLNPDDLLELDAGESLKPFETTRDPFEFPLDPERVAPVISELVVPTKTRARLYDHEKQLIIDSQFIYRQGEILRLDLPPPDQSHLPFYHKQRIENRHNR